MPTIVVPRQDWTAPLPGGLPGNSGTIAWSVCLAVAFLAGIPALLVWRRRRKQVAAQMAKTAEGAAAWRAHRAQEARDAAERRQRHRWRREEFELERLGAQRLRDEETVPGYEEGAAPPEYYAPPPPPRARPDAPEHTDTPHRPAPDPRPPGYDAAPDPAPPVEPPPPAHVRES